MPITRPNSEPTFSVPFKNSDYPRYPKGTVSLWMFATGTGFLETFLELEIEGMSEFLMPEHNGVITEVYSLWRGLVYSIDDGDYRGLPQFIRELNHIRGSRAGTARLFSSMFDSILCFTMLPFSDFMVLGGNPSAGLSQSSVHAEVFDPMDDINDYLDQESLCEVYYDGLVVEQSHLQGIIESLTEVAAMANCE